MKALDNAMPDFSPSFRLFQQEGYLVRGCLTTGLTALRDAPFKEKGQYYTAFFQLSMGFERLMKLILILDHMAEHTSAVPSRSVLKNYGGKTGHDLVELVKSICSHSPRSSDDLLETIKSGSLAFDLINFLTDFGNGARYYNLDALSSEKPPDDPLSRWNRIVQRILAEDFDARHQDRVRRSSAALAEEIKDFTIARGFDLEGRPVSLEQMLPLSRLHQMAAPRAVLHLMGILVQLKALLEEACNRAQRVNQQAQSTGATIPYLIEFFDFVTDERHVVLRKKRWP